MKRSFSVILSLILMAALWLPFLGLRLTADAADDTGLVKPETKKVVSIVYDDSSSMGGDSRALAGYATQALAAMLNSNDELYISYMNQGYEETPVDDASLESTVQKILNRSKANGVTPESAIQDAWGKLNEAAKKPENVDNPYVDYWLFVIADGAFSRIDDKWSLERKINTLCGFLTDCAKTKPDADGRSKDINLAYLAIGSNALYDKDLFEKYVEKYNSDNNSSIHLYAFPAESSSKITLRFSEIANLISNRKNVTPAIDTKAGTMTFSSALPLKKLSVIAQGASELPTVTCNGTPLEIKREVTIQTPGSSMLVSKVFSAVSSSGSIPAGEIVLTFPGGIGQKTDIFVEPALMISLNTVMNGIPVDLASLKDVSLGDTFSFTVGIFINDGSMTPVTDTRLLGDFSLALSCTGPDGKLLLEKSGEDAMGQTDSITVTEYGDYVINAVLECDGYVLPLKKLLQSVPPRYSVTGGDSCDFFVGGGMDCHLEFTATKNGYPMSGDDIKSAATISCSDSRLLYDVIGTGTTLHIIPTDYQANELGSDIPVKFTVSLGDAEDEGLITVKPTDFAVTAKTSPLTEIYKTSLPDNTEVYVEFSVTMNGDTPVPRDLLEKLITVSTSTPDCTYEQAVSDGKVVITPKGYSGTVYGKASVDITLTVAGTKPISATERLTVRRMYTAERVGEPRSIKIEELAANVTPLLQFQFSAEGGLLEEDLRELRQSLTDTLTFDCPLYPCQNHGTWTLDDTGLLSIIPNETDFDPKSHVGVPFIDVSVGFSLVDNSTYSGTYSIKMHDYAVVPLGATGKLARRKLFSNREIGAAFYFTKDGIPMDKAALTQLTGFLESVTVSFDEEHKELVFVGADSMLGILEDRDIGGKTAAVLTVVPYSDNVSHMEKSGVWSFLFKGRWYNRLPKGDIAVTLGTANRVVSAVTTPISVTENRILCVFLPLLVWCWLSIAIVSTIFRVASYLRYCKGTYIKTTVMKKENFSDYYVEPRDGGKSPTKPGLVAKYTLLSLLSGIFALGIPEPSIMKIFCVNESTGVSCRLGFKLMRDRLFGLWKGRVRGFRVIGASIPAATKDANSHLRFGNLSEAHSDSEKLYGIKMIATIDTDPLQKSTTRFAESEAYIEKGLNGRALILAQKDDGYTGRIYAVYCIEKSFYL